MSKYNNNNFNAFPSSYEGQGRGIQGFRPTIKADRGSRKPIENNPKSIADEVVTFISKKFPSMGEDLKLQLYTLAEDIADHRVTADRDNFSDDAAFKAAEKAQLLEQHKARTLQQEIAKTIAHELAHLPSLKLANGELSEDGRYRLGKDLVEVLLKIPQIANDNASSHILQLRLGSWRDCVNARTNKQGIYDASTSKGTRER